MQEGHHITGVGDLMADNHESIRGDRTYFLKLEALIWRSLTALKSVSSNLPLAHLRGHPMLSSEHART